LLVSIAQQNAIRPCIAMDAPIVNKLDCLLSDGLDRIDQVIELNGGIVFHDPMAREDAPPGITNFCLIFSSGVF